MDNRLRCLYHNPFRGEGEPLYGKVRYRYSLEEQIGGQIEAGFAITGFYRDRKKEALFWEPAPEYIVTRAEKFPAGRPPARQIAMTTGLLRSLLYNQG
jgi:hypothetical protein